MTAQAAGRNRRLTRHQFLYGSALLAGLATLSACNGDDGSDADPEGGGAQSTAKGSVAKPLPAPRKLSESPTTAKQVTAGTLPALAKRLPEHPYVIPHRWVRRGKYGGTLNMIVFSSQGAAKADSNRQFFYGHSPLRWLNDGLDVGPGLVETWSSNTEATEWTFHFRKGLKWSDGQPFSTEDVLFWWEDLVLPGHFAQVPPDECRSGKNTLAKLTAPDSTTLTMTFDAPAPLTADRIAMWPNGAVGRNGPIWVLPKHYLKQFHPKYNKKVSKNWDTVGGVWENKSDWMRNPDCPTLIGYRTKSFDNNKGVVLERNPYYWAVTKDGDQLPYIDEIVINTVQDPQVGKLQVQQGKVDYCHGPYNQIDLSDVSTLMQSRKKAGTDVILWDSGSGTGSMFFLNYDYPDPILRTLFREPKFRQAISYAFNRDEARKSLYFQTGDKTTGTSSPKASEFHLGAQSGQVYRQWRDAYSRHDPAKAKSLLAELGLKDTDGDGYLELPGGKNLTVRIDYSADIAATEAAKDEQLVRDCKAVGLRMVRNPISPVSYSDQWNNGTLMAHSNWEVTDTPSILVIAPWVVPIEPSRWAPLEGQFYTLRGTAGEHRGDNADPWKRKPPRLEPDAGGPIATLWRLYSQAQVEPDKMRRAALVWQMIKVHREQGPFFMGTVANYPQVVVAKTELQNVPRKQNLAQNGLVNAWATPCPASYDPECYYWQDPTAHA